MPAPESSNSRAAPEWFIALVVGVFLPMPFFGTLLLGEGLVGGDLYTYFFPQKVFLNESLRHGELPLWHSWTGFGYPFLAESQVGLFYPPHLLLYGLFDTNTAYNWNQLLHYLATFFCTWMFARQMRISHTGSLLAGTIFTFAWFPSRICLEWAIIGGPWMPLGLWLLERGWETGRWRYALWLSIAIGVQIFAGHFNLAFLNLLTLAVYVPARLFWATNGLPEAVLQHRWRGLWIGGITIALGILLAGAQWLPTLELRQHSDRSEIGRQFHPADGHIPPQYLLQVLWPWNWYGDPHLDQNLSRMTGAFPALTNRVEAQLYWGVLPLILILTGCWHRSGPWSDRRYRFWAVWGLAAVLYSTGWPLVVLQHVPGFNFFRGPGRYGMIATFAAAMWAAKSFDAWFGTATNSPTIPAWFRRPETWGAVIIVLTIAEYWYVTELVSYAVTVREAPIHSWNIASIPETNGVQLGKILREIDRSKPVRLFAPGANLPNLLGVSSVPEYLGIAPLEYSDPDFKAPSFSSPNPTDDEIARRVEWMQRVSVTHILSFERLDQQKWPVALQWEGLDGILNLAWARKEPLYLYALHNHRERIHWMTDNGLVESLSSKSRIQHRSNSVRITLDEAEPGGKLVLNDLDYPGWCVTIDGLPAKAERHGIFRAVQVPAGSHTVEWRFRPRSVIIGCSITLLVLMLIAAIGHLRFWHPQRLNQLLHRWKIAPNPDPTPTTPVS